MGFSRTVCKCFFRVRILAVLGILFLGIIFVPLAAIVALIGTIIAVKNRNMAGIGVNVLAWILVLFGFFTSPILMMALGVTVGAAH